MPELPEVETIVRGLRPHVEGRRIQSAEFFWPRTAVGDPDETASNLAGQRIRGLRRWGKYIVFDLARRRDTSVLVVHLRMTGNFLIDVEPGPFTRAVLSLQGGPTLIFNDIRKFGKWQWAEELPPRLRELGPEPLEISVDKFTEHLRARSAQIKAVLLNQEFLRGLGNIYVDESLFRAGIHPRADTAHVGPVRAKRLHAAIQETLQSAIAAGGSTVNNYVNSQGSEGYFQLQTQVYGKTGEACRKCSGPIRRTVIASRSTHFCPKCQRR